MHKPHLYLDQALCTGERIVLPKATAHHVSRVLRMRVGEELILFNGEGGEYDAEITGIDHHQVEVILGVFRGEDRESRLDITLVQGIARGQHMDYILQKAVELGVRRIVPVFTEHGNVRFDRQRLAGKLDHWRGLIINACEQCGRNRLAVLAPPLGFADWIRGDRNLTRLLLQPGSGTTLTALPRPEGPVSLLAGPEGGFSEAEISLALRHGYVAVTLGPRILRTETAAVTGISACQVLWGDLA